MVGRGRGRRNTDLVYLLINNSLSTATVVQQGSVDLGMLAVYLGQAASTHR